MCGIFGLVVDRRTGLDPSAAASYVRRLYRVAESRGKEASGLLLHIEGASGLDVHKAAVRGRHLIGAEESGRILARASDAIAVGSRVVILGHTRMVTNGDPDDNGNNQPVLGERIGALHNGIITNEPLLWERNPELTRIHEVDTEVAVRLMERSLAGGHSLATAFTATARRIAGANTLAVIDGRTGDLEIGTANGSLYWATVEVSPAGSALLFASEAPILRRAMRSLTRRSQTAQHAARIEQLQPDTGLSIAATGATPVRRTVAFGAEEVVGCEAGTRAPTERVARASAAIRDLAAIDPAAVDRLRRCTRCVLPETFPGIAFDDDGVCTVCRSYRPPVASGLPALLERIPTGTKVLFPLSGGRDSCYGLHVAVQELGLDVVAFTYDWGMVTDLARRNISRMCGALGIEHVLVSADITRKRANVRRNVIAWLRRPELGTIPLFMAGDKQFFFHAQRLRREHEAGKILFSMNPFERTDFKVGFAGISDGGSRKDRHYDLDAAGKVRILAYYSTQMLKNRAYLNPSLIDTASGFLSYYLVPKDFLSLYEHLEWREDEVDRVLLEQYRWETAEDSSTTWRIGDGTAPFYNYLYLRIAGFSENDALRSNQVRSGHMLRDDAMQRLRSENLPRTESLAWYLETIGLDARRVIERVNLIPSLYP